MRVVISPIDALIKSAVKPCVITSNRCISILKKMSLEEAKQAAAFKAVDNYVKQGHVVGVGSGSTVVYAVERIKQRVEKEGLQLTCVPSSFQAKQLITSNGLTLGDLESHPAIDVTIDGADEVDENMVLIKGGGGCHLQEKILASCSKVLVVVADYTKDSKRLGDNYKKGIPIEVVPMAYVPVKNKICQLYGGVLTLRAGMSKAGPCVTDNGNFILDWQFDDQTLDWKQVNATIKMIPGVVETGLFVSMAHKAFFGLSDGRISERW